MRNIYTIYNLHEKLVVVTNALPVCLAAWDAKKTQPMVPCIQIKGQS